MLIVEGVLPVTENFLGKKFFVQYLVIVKWQCQCLFLELLTYKWIEGIFLYWVISFFLFFFLDTHYVCYLMVSVCVMASIVCYGLCFECYVWWIDWEWCWLVTCWGYVLVLLFLFIKIFWDLYWIVKVVMECPYHLHDDGFIGCHVGCRYEFYVNWQCDIN